VKAAGRPPRILVSFLTRGMSLEAWRRGGMLQRELAPFRELVRRGWQVELVSFGGRRDASSAPEGIRVHCNALRLPAAWYVRLLSLRLRRLGAEAVVRSNQVRGAELAADFARRRGLPFVARCGYLPSLFSEWEHGAAAPATRADRELERVVFGAAERVVVTTDALAHHVREAYGVPAERITTIPNFVETDRFAPAPERAEPDHVVFVGRLEAQKRPSLLVQALAGTRWRLTIVGSGPLGPALAEEAKERGVGVRFEGNVAHGDLPGLLQRAAVFCLPSRYEGHPKALLEAMACGLAVVATDAPGIRDVLRDGETGLLCKPEPRALRSALESLLDDPERRAALGRAARRWILERCTLEHAVAGELAVLEAVRAP
jgi:glycosyltransferase involved in cell wall biosynthesis